MFTDPELDTYLTLADQDPFTAAALALEAIAVDEILTYRIVRTDDLTVDGVTGAKALLARAEYLRSQSPSTGADDFSLIFAFDDPRGVCVPEATARPFPWR